MSFEWLNEDSRTFLERGYLEEGISAEERIGHIADAAEDILGIKGFADKFYYYMSKGYYSLSSPVWSNFGLDRGLPISCNGVYVEDSIEQILQKTAEVGMQTKLGAGTSGYFGDIRPRGSKIKTGGKADGPVHYIRLYDAGTDIISQGSVRRGAFAAYLNIDHDDIEEFLEIREPGAHIQNISLGVTITNDWFQSMIDGDKAKREIWAKVLRKRRESGYPYLFFTDTVNNNKPQVLKDKDIPIHASNLCLKGDSIIEVMFPFYSESSKIDIETFVKLWSIGGVAPGTKVKTENGFCEVSAAAQTGSTKEMIRITDNDTGKSIECTPDHKIFTQNRGWVMAKDLREDDDLLVE